VAFARQHRPDVAVLDMQLRGGMLESYCSHQGVLLRPASSIILREDLAKRITLGHLSFVALSLDWMSVLCEGVGRTGQNRFSRHPLGCRPRGPV
jgi:hypothetical protein